MMILDPKLAPALSKVFFKDEKASGEGEDPDDTKTKPPAQAVEKIKNYKQKLGKICNGIVEDYLKWAKSLQNYLFEGKPC